MTEELNKKLAEWRFPIVTQIFMPDGWVPKGRICFFEEPNPDDEGEENESYDTCDLFTLSLDACFKWLVPKLDSYTLVADKINEHQASVRESGMYFHGEAGTPALALCLAISKLIGEK